jgi:signal transduction histidine kinase
MSDELASDPIEAETDHGIRKFHLWPRTVRVRLTIVATLVFAIALSACAFGVVRVVHNNLVDRIKTTQQAQLDHLAKQFRNGDIQPAPQPDGHLTLLVGPDGNVVGVVERPQPRDGYYESRRVIETTAGNVTLVAQRSVAEVNATVHNVSEVMLLVVPILVALVALAAWYFAGRALKPVEAIRAEAAAITGTTMHRRVPEPDTDDEIGRLARTMNAMLDRLELSSQRQRQFVSDASHELRSPLASIRANLEVALRHSDRADWPAVAQRALAEDQRMEDTVTELLELARLDEAEEKVDLAALPEVDVDEIVLDQALQETKIPVDVTRVAAGRVHGRREQLARVVRNLLDNACRHARSRVAVSLQSHDTTVELTVDDDGPGIAPADRDRVFERFTRLDDGRARDAGGLGIGLAIVKATVEQHGGTITIDAAPLGGARFIVTLPTV